MAPTYNEDILDTYPQPLAATYARFIDQRDAAAQHNLLLALFECTLKYLASAATAQYLALGGDDATVSDALSRLAHPSLGHWAALLRGVLGWRRQHDLVADEFIFPELVSIYHKASAELPAGAALVRQVRQTSEMRITLRQLFDALVEYRNQQAHGAGQGGAHYAAMVPLLQAAAEETLLALPSLAGHALTFVESISIERGGTQVLSLLRLMSDRPRLRAMPKALDPATPRPEPQQLHLLPGADLSGAIPLHPLLVFLPACAVCQEAQVGVLNGLVAQAGEYLCYGCGHATVLPALAHDMAAVLPDRREFTGPATPGMAEPQQEEQPKPPAAPHNLPPQLTAFVGREHESEALRVLLRRPTVRLVTLTGPGGTGKTRLALQSAGQLLAEFPDGVWFVDLAPLTNPELVLPTIAHVLGMQNVPGRTLLETLQADLARKRTLLVLDNFEHLAPAARLISDLLKATGDLKLLITSRMPLHVYGEKELAVQPLGLPARHLLPPLDELAQYDAVKLFVERAQDVRADFALTAENAPAVVAICHRLDGLPLAIELAAARVKLLPPAAMLQKLQSRLKVLTGGARDRPERQQTLRAAIEWSHHLLEDGEKALFRRLAVFVGGGTLEAVAAVCNAAGELPDVLEIIASLVDKSLLKQQEVGGEPRFRMLETIREYALERLEESAEAQQIHRRYADFWLALVEAAEPDFVGMEPPIGTVNFDAELDNIRAALGWLIMQRDAQSALRLAGAYWAALRQGFEWRKWLEEVLALPEAQEPTAARAKALTFAAGVAWPQGDIPAARAFAEEGAALYRQLGDRRGVASALLIIAVTYRAEGAFDRAGPIFEEIITICRELGLTQLLSLLILGMGQMAIAQGDYALARARIEEGLAQARALNSEWLVAQLSNGLGDLERLEGQHARAEQSYRESLALFRETDSKLDIPAVLHNLGHAVLAQGDHEQARTLFAESLALQQVLGNEVGIAEGLAGFAGIAAVLSRDAEHAAQAPRAARLFGASAALRETLGAPLWPAEQAEWDRNVALARAQLDEEAWQVAWQEGRAMTIEQAIEYASGRAPAE